MTTDSAYSITFSNTSPSTSPDSGSVVIHGGLGVIGDIFAGGTIVPLKGLDLVNQRIRNVADPVSPNDVLTLGFFERNAEGIQAGPGLEKNVNIISVSPNLPHVTTVGTLRNGVWNASTITVPYGGTGASIFPTGQILFGAGTDPLQSDSTFTYNRDTKSLFLGGLNDTSGLGTGTLSCLGGASFNKSLFVGGNLSLQGMLTSSNVVNITNVADVTSGGLAALNIAGGLDATKSIRSGANISASGTITGLYFLGTGTTDSTSPTLGGSVLSRRIICCKVYNGWVKHYCTRQSQHSK